MPQDRFRHFLNRVKGEPFSHLNMDRGKVNLRELYFQHDVTLDPDHFFSYRVFLTRFDTVFMDVRVLEGSEIDLLITNDYNYGRYIRGDDFIYIVTGSILKMIKICNIFVAQEDGMYHLILDNTYYPVNGARPNCDINGGVVRVRMAAKTHQPLQADFEKPAILRC